MDQEPLVNERIEDGRLLIEALAASGFTVRVAFWARPTEEEKWYLYLASPFVDEKGSRAAYLFIDDILRKRQDVWVDPMEVRVVGLRDSVTEAVLAKIKPEVPNSPYAARKQRPYPSMIRLGGTTIAGVHMDGVSIYPPPQPAASA